MLFGLAISIPIVDQNPDIADCVEYHGQIPIPVQNIIKPTDEKDGLLKMSLSPTFLQSFKVKRVHMCKHMSFLAPDNIWVSDDKNRILLTNIKGGTLHLVKRNRSHGIHTVSSDRDLIYIDNDNNIKTLSEDLKLLTTTFLEAENSQWKLLCVHCCQSTGDLLVGMTINKKIQTTIDLQITDLDEDENQCIFSSSKVTRYNKTGEETQTIQFNNDRLQLYRLPLYITENKNGDVVVSDNKDAVVVTDRGGKHRFTFTRHPSGSTISPRGVCTDSLSHILVVDVATQTIIMINNDGHFLSYLLTISQNMHHIGCLCYDFHTSRLWVGSWKMRRVSVYRHIDKKDALTGKYD